MQGHSASDQEATADSEIVLGQGLAMATRAPSRLIGSAPFFGALGLSAIVLIVQLIAARAEVVAPAAAVGLSETTLGLVVKVKDKQKHKDEEHSCPAGYVVLDKPNKYGSFCELKETPQPTAEKCKFGMIGTPPNDCHCPQGTEFSGYKGCVAVVKKMHELCVDFDGYYQEKTSAFSTKCYKEYSGSTACFIKNKAGDWRCCCRYEY
jgi:hypothetical protein